MPCPPAHPPGWRFGTQSGPRRRPVPQVWQWARPRRSERRSGPPSSLPTAERREDLSPPPPSSLQPGTELQPVRLHVEHRHLFGRAGGASYTSSANSLVSTSVCVCRDDREPAGRARSAHQPTLTPLRRISQTLLGRRGGTVKQHRTLATWRRRWRRSLRLARLTQARERRSTKHYKGIKQTHSKTRCELSPQEVRLSHAAPAEERRRPPAAAG